EEDGTIPIRKVGHKAFGGAMVAAGGAGAVSGAGLGLIGKAKELFQKAFVAEGMQHIQIVEALPLPIFGVGFISAFFQTLDGPIGGGAQEFVIVPKLHGEPTRGALGKDALKKSEFAPMVEFRVLAKMGFEKQVQRAVQRCVQERDDHGIGVGDTVPI